MSATELDESSELSPRRSPDVHYHYAKSNGNAPGSRVNTVLLGCLIAIMGFVGAQVWIMNGEMKAMRATLDLVVSGRLLIPPRD